MTQLTIDLTSADGSTVVTIVMDDSDMKWHAVQSDDGGPIDPKKGVIFDNGHNTRLSCMDSSNQNEIIRLNELSFNSISGASSSAFCYGCTNIGLDKQLKWQVR